MGEGESQRGGARVYCSYPLPIRSRGHRRCRRWRGGRREVEGRRGSSPAWRWWSPGAGSGDPGRRVAAEGVGRGGAGRGGRLGRPGKLAGDEGPRRRGGGRRRRASPGAGGRGGGWRRGGSGPWGPLLGLPGRRRRSGRVPTWQRLSGGGGRRRTRPALGRTCPSAAEEVFFLD